MPTTRGLAYPLWLVESAILPMTPQAIRTKLGSFRKSPGCLFLLPPGPPTACHGLRRDWVRSAHLSDHARAADGFGWGGSGDIQSPADARRGRALGALIESGNAGMRPSRQAQVSRRIKAEQPLVTVKPGNSERSQFGPTGARTVIVAMRVMRVGVEMHGAYVRTSVRGPEKPARPSKAVRPLAAE